MNKPFAVFVKATGAIPFTLMTNPKYYFEDINRQGRHIRGKAIVMPDHHSIWDVATMMHAFPGRNLRCVIAEVIVEGNPLMRLFAKSMGYVVVDRNSSDFSFMSKAQRILDEDGVVEIFPESRLPRPGEETPLEFKPSVTYLALESGAPIIPVVSNGSFNKKERMAVMIGVPINVRELYDESLGEKENVLRITELLRNKIIELKKMLDEQIRADKEKDGAESVEKEKTNV